MIMGFMGKVIQFCGKGLGSRRGLWARSFFWGAKARNGVGKVKKIVGKEMGGGMGV